MMPYARTVISVLQTTLSLVESCGHLPGDSSALAKLREGVEQTIAELESVAKRDPRSEFQAADENFFRTG